MTRSLTTTILALILAGGSAANAANVEFRQLNWMADDGTVLVFASAVGEAEFVFDGADPADQQFLQDQGGAFVNIVLSANSGQPAWVVQNLYLCYPDDAYLAGSTPSVQFRLPLLDGEIAEFVQYGVQVTEAPLDDPFFDVDQFGSIQLSDYHVGGREGGGSGLAAMPFIIGPWIGNWWDSLPVDFAWISVPTADVEAVEEDLNGCAPGSCARSIAYLGDTNDFATDSAQDIYDDIKDDMDTDASGTTDDNMLAGKNKYTNREGLPICSKLVYNFGEQIDDIMKELRGGADVEILISWTGGGGHAAMITSIVKHADGSYTITYVDDDQTKAGAQNEEHTIKVKPDGSFDGGQVDGFLVEVICEAGDADHDGDVDQADLGLVLAAYGSHEGDDHYNPNADFDQDGDVDQGDLGELLGNFGAGG